MELLQDIVISKPIAECWNVLGNQFTEIDKWASPVNHAEGDGKQGTNGANCNMRGCNIEGMGDIKEKLMVFDPKSHYLAYEVISGLPGMMKSAKNSWKLTAINDSQTKVNMKGAIQPKGLIGAMMKPMLKMQFGKMTKNLMEEFKFYVETGKPHARKVKAAGKFAA